MWKPIDRRTFITAMSGCVIAAVSGKVCFDAFQKKHHIPCRLLGPSRDVGHLVRDGLRAVVIADNDRTAQHKRVVIVGGGIAGLSAAWWLKRNGFNDFVLLELEKHVGGNSSSGKNQYSSYPWGAHYVPLANAESEYVRLLFKELGIIQSVNPAGEAVYDELYLCHDPQERLLKDGVFQEGLIPHRGLQPDEKAEMARFFKTMAKFRQSVGKDGKPAFAIPLDLSSADAEFVALDKQSMGSWLAANEFHTKPLMWYVNYCCRDDYGSSVDNVSAWAGIHYFAGRRGTAANAEPNSVVTWPEGNGFLVEKLRSGLGDHVVTGNAVTRITQDGGNDVRISYLNTESKETASLLCDYAIFAAPRFVAKHIIGDPQSPDPIDYAAIAYAPWMVANITVGKIPGAKGYGLAWDNVSYYSNSLGYVVSTHQNIATRQGATVLTYYYPMAADKPDVARKKLFGADAEAWKRAIVEDLERMHPGISDEMLSIDLWPWGHGMICPSVGYIWGPTRKKMKESDGRIFFAHSDMSGISNFEEAQYHGVKAATFALEALA